MRILFVMDPLGRLDLKWDTSLCLLRELHRRGHETWAADAADLSAETASVFAYAREIHPRPNNRYQSSKPKRWDLKGFDCILVRKDPPFDSAYLHMTYLLDRAADQVSVVNHPRGIRNTNEKISCLRFPTWIPETIATNSPKKILEFQSRLKTDVILKPIDQKGGKDILLAPWNDTGKKSLIEKATRNGTKVIVAQRFLKGPKVLGDKRILILNGEILSAFEKHFPAGDFRANLSLGGTFHPTTVTQKEKRLVKEMRPYFLAEGLFFVGIDVMDEKLIEINVTSPAGLVETQILYPGSSAPAKVARFLERLAASGH